MANTKASPAPTSLRAGTALSTVSAPSSLSPADAKGSAPADVLETKQFGAEAAAESAPVNPLKPSEFSRSESDAGQPIPPHHPLDTASTVQENTPSLKVGSGKPNIGFNPGNSALDRVRVDSTGRVLTTNQGVPVADNQNSLKAGIRGPTLMEDFILREKITSFDHERIPERVVHARGSAAHGIFECTAEQTAQTMAAPFQSVGKQTPVFVRFSTVAGERGSADTARDVRGFAVKFYTEEGNWDLVGNNMPVFFIQDAMKFPDLIHSVKPEQHHAMPQASSAHDTFWDFVSLMPESTHMLLWQMSDRAIPRSYRTMQGFGVHTFRLVNESGASTFVKFHWLPVAGTHSLVWDEAAKIMGADADYHRRDLWESIEAGNFPQYDLAFQTFTEAEAELFSFDVLDPTKLVPEEMVPLKIVGRLTLNRNPDNFFAETEQVAFCTAHVVRGIDFSNDPLLAGRHHSYLDTQLTRLGGPNFHEIPINASVAQVHNNQRDGFHRQAIPRGRAAYEPNSLGGGCPFQAGMKNGFRSFPQPVQEDKVRGKPEKFADHYSQATLFWKSQTPVEQQHIIRAFRFELSRVQTQAVRERVVSMLVNVAPELANGVATGLGFPMPAAMERVLEVDVKSELGEAPSLSLMARPGDGSVKGLKVAMLVAEGADGKTLSALYRALVDAGAAPRFVGPQLGAIATRDGESIHAETSLEAMPSVLFDAVVVPNGDAATALAEIGLAVDFVKEQFRHCKTMLVLDGGEALLIAARIFVEKSPGLVQQKTGDANAFIGALGKQRHFERESDPPLV